MNPAEAEQAADRLSKGLIVFMCAVIVVAAAVTVVRAARGHRPTKEVWSASFMGAVALFTMLPEIVPRSRLPAIIGLILLLAVGLWNVVRSKGRPQ